MMGIPSMWSGTCGGLKCLDVKQSIQLHTLPWLQLDQVEVSRRLDHVLQFPCKGKEEKHGRCHYFPCGG